MTPKQEERIRNKIKKIKAALAADKKETEPVNAVSDNPKRYNG